VFPSVSIVTVNVECSLPQLKMQIPDSCHGVDCDTIPATLIGYASYTSTVSGTVYPTHSSHSLSMIECGICHRAKLLPGPALQEDPFLCASCLNFRTLKYRLNIIHLLNINQIAVNDIDRILGECLLRPQDMLARYLKMDEKAKSLAFQKTNVSVQSVAMLGYMLVQVEAKNRRLNVESMQLLIEAKKQRNAADKSRIEMLREMKRQKEERLSSMKKNIETTTSITAKNNGNVARESECGLVKRQHSLIKQIRCSMLFDVLTLWGVEITNSEIDNSTQSSSGGSDLSILFIPVWNVDKLLAQSLNFIIQELLQLSQFIGVVSRILNIRLPFAMGTDRNEVRLGDRLLKFNVDETDTVYRLSEMGAQALCRGIARLALNLVVILRSVDTNYEHELNSMKDLLSLDTLLVRIIHSLKESIDFELLMRDKISKLLAAEKMKRERRQAHHTDILQPNRQEWWWWCRLIHTSVKNEAKDLASLDVPSFSATSTSALALPVTVRRHSVWKSSRPQHKHHSHANAQTTAPAWSDRTLSVIADVAPVTAPVTGYTPSEDALTAYIWSRLQRTKS
jgi:hypothetical protein